MTPNLKIPDRVRGDVSVVLARVHQHLTGRNASDQRMHWDRCVGCTKRLPCEGDPAPHQRPDPIHTARSEALIGNASPVDGNSQSSTTGCRDREPT